MDPIRTPTKTTSCRQMSESKNADERWAWITWAAEQYLATGNYSTEAAYLRADEDWEVIQRGRNDE